MQNGKILALTNVYSKSEKIANQVTTKDSKVYTPQMVKKYKSCFKTLLKFNKDRDKTLYIMYKKVKKWYKEEKNLNISLEKIHIRTKLGSYLSGGCGIGASLITSLTASTIFGCMNNYVKKFNPFSLIFYVSTVVCFGIIILINEDNEVEMYNIFLEALENLENDKTDK